MANQPFLPQKKIVKAGGGPLKEVTSEQYEQAMATPGLQPITSGGATALGANEDQAKMVGTQAQKTAATNLNVDPTKSASLQGRYTPPQPVPQQAEEDKEAKKERIDKLGTMGVAIEGLIKSRLQSLPAQSLQLNQTQLSTLPAAQQPGVKEALSAFLASQGNPAAQQAALQTLSASLGIDAVSPEGIQKYFSPTEIDPSINNPSLGELDLSSIGVDLPTLAQDLGLSPEELASYSLDDLNKEIQDLESKEFNQVQSLQTELGNAPSPNRRQQILRELSRLGALGTTGVEAGFDATQAALSSAPEQVFTLGGTSYSLEDLQKDGDLTALIQNASDEQVAEWASSDDPEAQSLAAFITANKEALQASRTEAGNVAQEFKDVQSELEELRTSIPVSLQDYFLPDEGYLTEEELIQEKARLEADSLYQAVLSTPELGKYLDSDLALALQGSSPEEIASLLTLTKELERDPALASLAGIQNDGKLLDPVEQQAVEEAKALYDSFGRNATLASNADFISALKNGDITPDIAEALGKNPQNWAAVSEFLQDKEAILSATKKPLTSAKNLDNLLDLMFGEVDINTLQQDVSRVAKLASYYKDDPNNENVKKWNELQNLGFKADGSVDADILAAYAEGRFDQDMLDSIAEEGDSLGILDGSIFAPKDDALVQEFEKMYADGKITSKELSSLSPTQFEDILKTPFGKSISSQQKVDYYTSQLGENIPSLINSAGNKELRTLTKNGYLKQDGGAIVFSPPTISSKNPIQDKSSLNAMEKYISSMPPAVFKELSSTLNSEIVRLENISRNKKLPKEQRDAATSAMKKVQASLKQAQAFEKTVSSILPKDVRDGTRSVASFKQEYDLLSFPTFDRLAKADPTAASKGFSIDKRTTPHTRIPHKWLKDAYWERINYMFPSLPLKEREKKFNSFLSAMTKV